MCGGGFREGRGLRNRRRVERQRHHELSTAVGGRAIGDAPAVRLDQAVAHGQTQPRALARTLRGEEGREELWHEGGRHPGSAVADSQPGTAVAAAGAEPDAPRALRVEAADGVDRVGEEIEQHLLKLVPLPHDHGRLRIERALQLDAPLPHLVGDQQRGSRDHVVQVHRFLHQRARPGEGEEIPDDPRGPLRLVVDHAQVLPSGLGQPARRLEQQLRQAGDRGERVVQLVRDARDQLADGRHLLVLNELSFQRALLGHVSHENHDAAVGGGTPERGGSQAEPPTVALAPDFHRVRMLEPLRGGQQLASLRGTVRDRGGEFRAEQRLGRQARERGERAIGAEHLATGPDDAEAFGQRVERGFPLFGAPPDHFEEPTVRYGHGCLGGDGGKQPEVLGRERPFTPVGHGERAHGASLRAQRRDGRGRDHLPPEQLNRWPPRLRHLDPLPVDRQPHESGLARPGVSVLEPGKRPSRRDHAEPVALDQSHERPIGLEEPGPVAGHLVHDAVQLNRLRQDVAQLLEGEELANTAVELSGGLEPSGFRLGGLARQTAGVEPDPEAQTGQQRDGVGARHGQGDGSAGHDRERGDGGRGWGAEARQNRQGDTPAGGSTEISPGVELTGKGNGNSLLGNHLAFDSHSHLHSAEARPTVHAQAVPSGSRKCGPCPLARCLALMVAILLPGVAWPLQAQLPGLGAVEGRISGPDGALASASVRLLGAADRHATSDRLGRYRLDDVQPGTYTLEAAAVGFVPARTQVRIAAGAVGRVDVALGREAQRLADVSVTAPAAVKGTGPLPDVLQGVVYAGHKVEVVRIDSLDLNAAQDVSRQVLGRVPGLNVAETGGAGFPANGIGFRGLDPSQSVEVNVRQDGYNIAADPYGYPEAYFLPPAEALERVELVRGASSLAFGSQFGGMVNYVIRDGLPGSGPVVRSRLTGASYATFDGFGDVAGGIGPVTYYGFVQFRTQDGWRPNGDSRQVTGFGRVRWQPSPRWRLGAEYTLFRNRIHMPGGLTDLAFAADPGASFRSRNWLGSPWNVLALTADYAASANLAVHTTVWGNLSQRYLVWRNEDGGAGVADSIDPVTSEFVPREVEREKFSNVTLESRVTWSFPLLGRMGTLAAGVRAFAGRMHRQEGGPGSTGSDFDLALYGGPYEKDVTFGNTNLAAHLEQVVRLGDRLTVAPGIRVEYLRSTTSGYTDTTFVPLARSRTFALPGIGAQFRASATTQP